MHPVAKRALITIIIVIVAVALIVGGYVVYVASNYYREGDVRLDVSGASPGNALTIGQEYRALSWNIGFGAYQDDYSFFMDECVLRSDVEGVGAAGDTITGVSSTAQDRESAASATSEIINSIDELSLLDGQQNDFDFVLLQEVDTNSHRTFQVNQVDMITSALAEENQQYVFSNNFHTVWLQYPVLNPIGDIQSGLLTVSRYTVNEAWRHGYTIDDSFPTKFFDLDRCFSASYVPIQGSDAQLVVINSHMTAYSSSNSIREQQLKELMAFANSEYEQGNYVIIGGDFNQIFSSDAERGATTWQNAEEIPSWVGLLDASLLGGNFAPVYASNEFETSTCRDASFPYIKGENYEAVIDGFIVSRNIEASATNIQENFAYSDHNPVKLTFKLL